MLKQILDIIKLILDFFFNKKKNEKIEELTLLKEQRAVVDFKSKVEEVAKNAPSKDIEIRKKAIDDMRKLIAE